MRKTVICGNWKMHKTVQESVQLANEIVQATKNLNQVTIVIAPTHLATAKVADVIKNSQVKLAVQDIHFENQGAYTGKVSVDMIKDIGVEYVIIGHSEQRQYFAETDVNVNKKVVQVLASDMTPIVCIGETLAERESGELESVLKKQLASAFTDISEADVVKVIIAYEPVWAIGSGVTATNEQAQKSHEIIRLLLANLYSDALAQSIVIQYGGSMNSGNARGLINQKDIDGGLIGGAALNAESFVGIIEQCIHSIK